jgi:hypothetical protein
VGDYSQVLLAFKVRSLLVKETYNIDNYNKFAAYNSLQNVFLR